MAEEEIISKHLYELFKEEGIDRSQLKDIFLGIHPVDLATFLNDLDIEDRVEMVNLMDLEQAIEVLKLLPPESANHLIPMLSQDKIASILERLPPDNATDIVLQLEGAKRSAVIQLIKPEYREKIRKLVIYPKHTAGGIMTTSMVKVQEDQSVADAFQNIQLSGAEVYQDVYVVDQQDRLKGVCNLRTLLQVFPNTPVSQVMQKEFEYVRPDLDQEEVARIVEMHKLESIPVVDKGFHLLGVINLHDILQVIHQEDSEDMYRLAGSDYTHPLYTSIFKRMGLRLPWLLLALVGELLLALIIVKIFQPTLEKLVILAAFIPAVMAIGGGIGLQATTVVVRGLGMGTITLRQTYRTILGELRLGIILGSICGLLAALTGMLINLEHPEVARVGISVFIAMVLAAMGAAVVGAIMPLLMEKLRLDPAVACGPFITVFNDFFSTVLYLSVASLIGFA